MSVTQSLRYEVNCSILFTELPLFPPMRTWTGSSLPSATPGSHWPG